MHKNISIIALLFATPLISFAASVADLNVLGSKQTTLSQLQQSSNPVEPAYDDERKLGKDSFELNTDAYADLEKPKIIRDSGILKPRQQNLNNIQNDYNVLKIVHERIVSSDDESWREISSSLKDANDALNKINDWAGSFLNDYVDNSDLSSINFRSTALQQQNTNYRAYISEQDSDAGLLPEDNKLPDTTAVGRPGFLVGVIGVLTSPTLVLKILAENFSIIAVVLTLSMGFKLLMKFIVHKTKKRKHRIKSKTKKKRGLDGFID